MSAVTPPLAATVGPELPPRQPYTWQWRGHTIGYQRQGDRGPAVVLIHGFGASWRHWRKNIPFLARSFRVFALDMIGFGSSAKPAPSAELSYTFETWSAQLRDFCREVVGEPAFLVGNSIGCVMAMQAAVDEPDQVRGVALLNCSLRLLHDRRRATLPWYRNVGAGILQQLLGISWLGRNFFHQIARPPNVRKALLQAYRHPEAVTDELIEILMEPARDPGAADVFLAFTRYSQGPLPEDLLPRLTCPCVVLWGSADPWEPVEMGRSFEQYPAVEKFIPLEGVGHCPQDEAPKRVNYILRDWILHKAGEHLQHPPLAAGDWVQIAVDRPDGDPLWNGLRGRVEQVGQRAVTVRLEAGQGKRHFYREDIQAIAPPPNGAELLLPSHSDPDNTPDRLEDFQ